MGGQVKDDAVVLLGAATGCLGQHLSVAGADYGRVEAVEVVAHGHEPIDHTDSAEDHGSGAEYPGGVVATTVPVPPGASPAG
ncbi:hypothetical protein [Streptomyces bicolor]|uniref:hypothetical protein n=1 Tax=Streptomyces bicolor TaxID=66874 RepID=UPI0004E0BA13|nr:hypothetical protein [Streptomyces bicolor]